jgi:RNA polymerase sigma factor for flagellar operon FliA
MVSEESEILMATSALAPSRDFVSHDLRARPSHPYPLSARGFARASGPAARCKARYDSHAGETDAERERRVLELLPLVRRVALKMRRNLPAHVELDDLMGAGTMGLLDAAQKFDVRRKVKMESYARHRIRGAILDGLRSLDTASRDLRKKSRKLEETARALQLKLHRPVEDEEMAQALGLSLDAWHRSRQQLQAAGLDCLHPMQETSLKPACVDALVAPDQKNQFDLCYHRECRDIANQALACLPERERKIIFQYHLQEMTMKEIGSKLGIDESRVSQLHSAAIERLRLSAKAILERNRTLSASPGGSFGVGRA